jgi:hypothetical protein
VVCQSQDLPHPGISSGDCEKLAGETKDLDVQAIPSKGFKTAAHIFQKNPLTGTAKAHLKQLWITC